MFKYVKTPYWPFPSQQPSSSVIFVSAHDIHCASWNPCLILRLLRQTAFAAAVSDELAKQNARKTISVSDVLEGLGLMDFPEDIRSEVKSHLKAFRQSQSDKKAGKAVKGDAAGAGGEDDEDEDEEEGDAETQETTTRPDTVEEPPAKPTGEQDVDEEDEDTEQRMVEEGAQEGEVDDDPMDEDN